MVKDISLRWNPNKLCCRLHKSIWLDLSCAEYAQYASFVHIRFTLILSWHVRLGIPRVILFTLSRLKLDIRVCQLMHHVPLIALIFITYLNIITADVDAFWETLSKINASSHIYRAQRNKFLFRGCNSTNFSRIIFMKYISHVSKNTKLQGHLIIHGEESRSNITSWFIINRLSFHARLSTIGVLHTVVSLSLSLFIYVSVCVCVCVYIYIYIL